MKSKYQNKKELTITFEDEELDELYVILCRAEADRRRFGFEPLPTYTEFRRILEEALDAD
ncbi:hypothetical protein PBI_PEREGRIN_14 [Rhodococcus phage Peregrin]|nr:hypothetical protein PBI_PEREGRIN_14 [Rhodococcus phage Peregrin]